MFKTAQFLFSFVDFVHYHNMEQWQIKLKPIQKNFKPRINLNHNINIFEKEVLTPHVILFPVGGLSLLAPLRY